MKFLALHGAYGNIPNYKVQLGPMLNILENEGTVKFHFVEGKIAVTPPPGFEGYFGPAPHYRFFKDNGEGEKSALEGVRVFPEAATPEDSLRALMAATTDGAAADNSRALALEELYKVLEADPEIRGVIGYSEGASAAATLVLDEQMRMKNYGRVPQIRCAMFFMGWPALDENSRPLLADEMDETIDVPSLHIVGANDPYKDGAEALYNLFDEDTAMFFDTTGGHTIPRQGKILDELLQAVRDLVKAAGLPSRTDSVVDSSQSFK